MKTLNISFERDELDFMDTDARSMLRIENEEIIYINKDLNDIWSKNVPKWRLHYERTGKLVIKFRGVNSMIVKLDDVTKEKKYKFKKQIAEKKDYNKLSIIFYKKMGIIKKDNLSKNYKIKKL